MYSVRYLNMSTVSEPRVRYDFTCLSCSASSFSFDCGTESECVATVIKRGGGNHYRMFSNIQYKSKDKILTQTVSSNLQVRLNSASKLFRHCIAFKPSLHGCTSVATVCVKARNGFDTGIPYSQSRYYKTPENLHIKTSTVSYRIIYSIDTRIYFQTISLFGRGETIQDSGFRFDFDYWL